MYKYTHFYDAEKYPKDTRLDRRPLFTNGKQQQPISFGKNWIKSHTTEEPRRDALTRKTLFFQAKICFKSDEVLFYQKRTVSRKFHRLKTTF